VLVAELAIRHTRRNMPTRRVALGSMYLPMSGPAPGAVLLRALAGQCAAGLDDDQRVALPALLREAADGLSVPRIALRHRLQTDVHGLDRSRHRLVSEAGHLVAEIDVHGRSVPQLVGAVMAAAALRREHRGRALAAIGLGVRYPGSEPAGVEVRFIDPDAWTVPLVDAGRGATGAGPDGRSGPGGPAPWDRTATWGAPAWEGTAPERRWAMEVLGFSAGAPPSRTEVQSRFRSLVREAHPDHGGSRGPAAVRLAELADARAVLLDEDTVPA